MSLSLLFEIFLSWILKKYKKAWGHWASENGRLREPGHFLEMKSEVLLYVQQWSQVLIPSLLDLDQTMLTWSKSTNERIRTWLHCWTERRTREFISRKWPDSQYNPFNQTEMVPSYWNFYLNSFVSKQYHSAFFYSIILWKCHPILLEINIFQGY